MKSIALVEYFADIARAAGPATADRGASEGDPVEERRRFFSNADESHESLAIHRSEWLPSGKDRKKKGLPAAYWEP